MITSRLAAARLAAALIIVGSQSVSAESLIENETNAWKRRLPEKTVSFQLRMARVPDLVKVLSRETGLPVIADAFADDPTAAALNAETVMLHVAVLQLPKVFEREVLWSNGVILLRHRQWLVKSRFSSTVYKWKTPPSGRGEIKKVAGGTPSFSGEVREIAAGVFGDQVSTLLGTSFRVLRPLSERRLSLYADSLTPLQAGGALTELLNGSSAITLGQTAQQRAEEEERYRQALDTRSPEEKLSDELKKEVIPLLTADQRQMLERNEIVDIPFKSLPQGVRKKAMGFAQSEWDRKGHNDPKNRSLDLSREMSLKLHPDARMMLAIDAFLDDGANVVF